VNSTLFRISILVHTPIVGSTIGGTPGTPGFTPGVSGGTPGISATY
jgi:hypothetical protein